MVGPAGRSPFSTTRPDFLARRPDSVDPQVVITRTNLLDRGERGGEQGLARGVPPWIARVRRRILHVNEGDSGTAIANSNCRLSRRLRPAVLGRRSMPPAWWRHCRSGRQQQYRGVSDHPKWPLGLPSLRPAMWSLTPLLKGCWRPCQHRQSAGSRGEFDAQPARELDGFLDALFTLVPAL